MASTALKTEPKTASETQPDAYVVDESKIRWRAYELWLARGCPTGSDQEDWFRAKEELSSK